MTISLDAKIPEGPLADKWDNHLFNMKLVNPSNRRKFKVILSLIHISEPTRPY